MLNFLETEGELAIGHEQAGRFAEAEAVYRRVIAVMPDHAGAFSNLGNLLMRRQCLEEAEAAYRRAVALCPTMAEAHNNLGSLLSLRGRAEDAEAALAAFRRALALKPDYADARRNLALLLLSLGRFDEAWREYEARSAVAASQAIPPDLPFPPWRGEPLAGKRIALWPEQGLGDYIQFVRYVPLLKAMGAARVTLYCPPALTLLLLTVAGVDELRDPRDAGSAPDHDYWVFPLSLPLHFGTTVASIPARLPYLRALHDRHAAWQGRLPDPGLRVGLLWRGNPRHRNDDQRSLPGLATLAPLWAAPGVRFVSLQKGSGEEEALAPPPQQPIVALGGEIRDFADTAAIVAQLDLTISVDTAVAHVAGALGKPCWVLLPAFGTDWRWLRGRTDSPWYPEVMRLFRQSVAGDWTEPVAALAAALAAWVQSRG